MSREVEEMETKVVTRAMGITHRNLPFFSSLYFPSHSLVLVFFTSAPYN